MLELLVAIALIVAMAKIASADDQSPIVWGALTGAIIVGCFFIPLPFLRLGIAFVVAFVAMIGYKVVRNR
jgi:hypothetical protein